MDMGGTEEEQATANKGAVDDGASEAGSEDLEGESSGSEEEDEDEGEGEGEPEDEDMEMGDEDKAQQSNVQDHGMQQQHQADVMVH